VAEFGGTGLDEVGAEAFAAWFAGQWADRAPSTWNVSLVAVRSAAATRRACGDRDDRDTWL